jgi:hypothetical protein
MRVQNYKVFRKKQNLSPKTLDYVFFIRNFAAHSGSLQSLHVQAEI